MQIDLRSDAATLPSAAMRGAMAEAPVGDDRHGEDPTVNGLQEYTAELLGKEAALFVASGTMANQIALKVLTRPSDGVAVGKDSHIACHELGAAAANAGVQFTPLGETGLFNAQDLRTRFEKRNKAFEPPITLVVVENTHNMSGGRVFPAQDCSRIGALANELGISSYMDGARLMNAAVYSGVSAATFAEQFDMVGLSLSKGLGAPVGSVLAGSSDHIALAVRWRRILGGAMCQAGIIAAGGLYALQHNVERLEEDHRHAKLIAEKLAQSPHLEIDPQSICTNIVLFQLNTSTLTASALVEECKDRGVLIEAFSDRTLRLVTHMDVDAEACRFAADTIALALQSSNSR